MSWKHYPNYTDFEAAEQKEMIMKVTLLNQMNYLFSFPKIFNLYYIFIFLTVLLLINRSIEIGTLFIIFQIHHGEICSTHPL